MRVADVHDMRIRCIKLCQTALALTLVWPFTLSLSSCADGDSVTPRIEDGPSESCALPCDRSIAACIELASGEPVDHASIDFEATVRSVGGVHTFGAGVRCLGLNANADSLTPVELTDSDGAAWFLALSEDTTPTDYLRVGQNLTLHYEDGEACIFGGRSRLLMVEDADGLVLFVMHDDQVDGLAIPGFELAVGNALCQHDDSCGFVPRSTLVSTGAETVQNACAATIGDFTLTQTFQAFHAGTSPLCDGCSHHLVAGHRHR
jgi:hypothetical protein